MKRLFTLLFCLPLSLFGDSGSTEDFISVLRQRQPHWLPKTVTTHPNSKPKEVLFYAPDSSSTLDIPVKWIEYYPMGTVKRETDLSTEGGKVFPHGASVWYGRNGKIEKLAFYQKGMLHGPMRTFFENGREHRLQEVVRGVYEGRCALYNDHGKLLMEGQHQSGKRSGTFVSYHPNGEKAGEITYRKGVPHGVAREWYLSGETKETAHFLHGVLHGTNSQKALIRYDEDHVKREEWDFRRGMAYGTHLFYYGDSQLLRSIPYWAGVRHGREVIYDRRGGILGEGVYYVGRRQGRHYRRHPNGVLAWEAQYNERGELPRPEVTYNEDGDKQAEFKRLHDRFEGNYLEWYPDGQLKIDFFYRGGLFDGVQKEYHKDGTQSLQAKYQNGKPHGSYELWYSNGERKIQMNYRNGVKKGPSGEWYLSGVQKSEAHYSSGELSGWNREWDTNGILLHEAYYEESQPEGIVRSWYTDGNLSQVIHYHKGKRDGPYQKYYNNQQIAVNAIYEDDLCHGLYRSWFFDGTLHEELRWEHGIPIGTHIAYHPLVEGKKSPQLAKKLHFKSGEPHGEQRTWYVTGQIHSLITYHHGILHGRRAFFDKQGKIMGDAHFNQGRLRGRYFERVPSGKEIVYHYQDNRLHGPHQVFYPLEEGKKPVLAVAGEFVNGELEGHLIEFHPNGVKSSCTSYCRGRKNGDAAIYNSDGNLLISARFSGDLQQGPAKEYFPDGAIYKEVNFVDDFKEGKETVYHLNGRVVLQQFYHRGRLQGSSQQFSPEGTLLFEAEYQNGKRHGKFNKYYEDGSPHILQRFVDDERVERTLFDRLGNKQR